MLSLVLLLGVGCGDASESYAPHQLDTLGLPQPDSLAIDTLVAPGDALAVAPEDTATLEETPAPVAAPDAAAPAVLSDSLTLARLDSLQAQLARLTAALGTGAVAGTPEARAAEALERIARAEEGMLKVRTDTVKTAEARVKAVADEARGILQNLFWSLVLIVVVWASLKFIVSLLETLAERSAQRRLLIKKLIPAVRLVVWVIVVYLVIAVVFGISQEKLFAASAALGVAIGFAAQDILKNIFGGVIILLDQPFQAGDKISVGGTYGEVISIGLRSTRIVTPDDNLVSVPNAQIVDGQVSNANAGALDCQVVVDLFLPGWTDVMLAKRLAHEAAATSKYVFLGKPIVVNVKDVFKETFLTQLKVKAYVLDTRYEFLLASDITESAKAAFLEAGLLPAYSSRGLSDLPEAFPPPGRPAEEGASRSPGADPTASAGFAPYADEDRR